MLVLHLAPLLEMHLEVHGFVQVRRGKSGGAGHTAARKKISNVGAGLTNDSRNQISRHFSTFTLTQQFHTFLDSGLVSRSISLELEYRKFQNNLIQILLSERPDSSLEVASGSVRV